jgi:DNA-binding NarL/FixJ family response regulator
VLPAGAPEPRRRRFDLTRDDLAVVKALVENGTSGRATEVLWYSQSWIDHRVNEIMDKVGARTRCELAAMTALPEWPKEPSDGR